MKLIYIFLNVWLLSSLQIPMHQDVDQLDSEMRKSVHKVLNKKHFSLKPQKIQKCSKSLKDVALNIGGLVRAVLKEEGKYVIFKSHPEDCFQEIIGRFTIQGSKLEVELEVQSGQSLFCTDLYLFGFGHQFESKVLWTSGKYNASFTVSKEELAYIRTVGIQFTRLCDDLKDLPLDLWKSMNYFTGLFESGKNKKLKWFEENRRTLKAWTGIDMEKRNDTVINVKEEDLEDGDLLFEYRFDGVDTGISIFTGGRAAHVSLIVKKENETWVYESNDYFEEGFRGWLALKWDYWYQKQIVNKYGLVLVKLNDEKRELWKMNKQKVLEWVEPQIDSHTPYGYYNFLFGLFDTPNQNIPNFADSNTLLLYMQILENYAPQFVDNILNQPLRQRLQIEKGNLIQIEMEAAVRNTTIQELWASPEKDEWNYTIQEDGKQKTIKSRVCSAFVSELYKRAGLFGELDIQATEQTPRDLYQMKLYKNFTLDYCQGNGIYCQLTGNYVINLVQDQFNSQELYHKMNEKCSSIAPFYIKENSC